MKTQVFIQNSMMKKIITTATIVFLLVVSGVSLTGCQDKEIVDQEIEKQSILSDAEFQALTSGKVYYPKDMELTDKMKAFLIDGARSINSTNIKDGQIPTYNKEDLIQQSEWFAPTLQDVLDVVKRENGKSSEYNSKILNRNWKSFKPKNLAKFTYVPHYYEYDYDENPNQYAWCGHAALKCVASKHGSDKTLQQIHEAFSKNSSAYRNDRCNNGTYCSSIMDLLWAANNQNGGWWNYRFPKSSLEVIRSVENFYSRIRDGVDYDKPMIVCSSYPYGDTNVTKHFYPVVGYKIVKKNDGDIDYNKSVVYLRDVAIPKKAFYFERKVNIQTFYNHLIGNQVLFVRPGLV